MQMTREMIETIKSIVDEMELDYEYEYIGVRVQEQEFSLGKMDHVSHVWDNGNDTGIELDGVCVSKISSLGTNEYWGKHAAIVCGYSAEYGEDDGELIIRDAEVVAVIC